MHRHNTRLGLTVSACLTGFSLTLAGVPTAFASPLPKADAPPVVANWVHVSSPSQLEYIDQNQNQYLTSNIELEQSINLAGYTGWVPVGNASSPFSGTFNGNGYAISGLSVTDTSDPNVGMFGVTSGTIENLNVLAAVVSGGDGNTGAVVGEQQGGQIVDISISGSVTGGNGANGGIYFPGGSSGNVGGLVGEQLNGGTINHAQSSARVQAGNGGSGGTQDGGDYGGNGGNAGGLVGQAAGRMSQVASSGTVTSGSGGAGGPGGGGNNGGAGGWAGGLVGELASQASVTDAYATGAVTAGSGGAGGAASGGGNNNGGNGGNAGGLVGELASQAAVTDAYATAAVTAGSGGAGDPQAGGADNQGGSGGSAGGLVGTALGTMTNTYAVGIPVAGSGGAAAGGGGTNDGAGSSGTAGGFVGIDSSMTLAGTNFFNNATMGQGSGATSSEVGVQVSSLEYPNNPEATPWNFNTVWALTGTENHGYPYFRARIATTALPAATAGASYQATVEGWSGLPGGLTWQASGLPNGLSMNASGLITGTPHGTGTFQVEIIATDQGLNPVTETLPLIVEAGPWSPPVLTPETVMINGQSAQVIGNLSYNPPVAIQHGTFNGYKEERAAIAAGAHFSGEGTNSSYLSAILDGSGVGLQQHVSAVQQGQFSALYQKLGIIPTWTDTTVSIPQGVAALWKASAPTLAIENYLVQLDGFSWSAAEAQAAADFPIQFGT